MSADAVVRIRDVLFSYGAQPIIEGANLEIEKGSFTCFIGPNGGGKTTLLRLILGLLEPDRGSIEVLGGTPKASRPRVGYVPQHARFDPQFPIRVIDVVLMGRLKGGNPFGWLGKDDRDKANEALRMARVEDLGKRPFSDLSGGQQQRVLIARALACEPELLLLDEPTSNLDLPTGESFLDLLSDLNRRMSIVTVSHDLGVVSALVESVVCINRNVFVHSPENLTPEAVHEMYGGEVHRVSHNHGDASHG